MDKKQIEELSGIQPAVREILIQIVEELQEIKFLLNDSDGGDE